MSQSLVARSRCNDIIIKLCGLSLDSVGCDRTHDVPIVTRCVYMCNRANGMKWVYECKLLAPAPPLVWSKFRQKLLAVGLRRQATAISLAFTPRITNWIIGLASCYLPLGLMGKLFVKGTVRQWLLVCNFQTFSRLSCA